MANCNGCHAAPPQQFTDSGNPHLLPGFYSGKKQLDTRYYLGGAYDFGQFPAPGPGQGYAHIISRNLTPDKFGLPAGHTVSEFMEILGTGRDFDNAHRTCANAGNPNGQCIPFPFNGAVLQIMPWA